MKKVRLGLMLEVIPSFLSGAKSFEFLRAWPLIRRKENFP